MSAEDSPQNDNRQPDDTPSDDVWVELKRGSEGVSLTVYKRVDGETQVVDESWWTWNEFRTTDTSDTNGSTTTLSATPSDQSSAESIA